MGELGFGVTDHILWHACQLCYLQTVALACRAIMHVVQEHDAVVVLSGREVHVNGMLQLIGQLGQLEIVGGKQRVAAYLPGKVFGSSPGQGQAIKGAGATTNLVHQHQTVLGGVVQDVGGFGHFHHEGGAAAGDIVRGTHAGKNPVHGADHCPVGGHETAGVGEQGNQRGLTHIGGFTAHVRAGHHQHAALGVH